VKNRTYGIKHRACMKIMAEGSRDTLFFDNNGKEYLRIGADNIPADVTRNSPIGACNYRHFTMQR